MDVRTCICRRDVGCGCQTRVLDPENERCGPSSQRSASYVRIGNCVPPRLLPGLRWMDGWMDGHVAGCIVADARPTRSCSGTPAQALLPPRLVALRPHGLDYVSIRLWGFDSWRRAIS